MESQFESAASGHDADRWGTEWLDAARSGKLVRLADVVRARRTESGISSTQAAAVVVHELDELLNAGLDGLYSLDPAGWPVALQSADVWIPSPLNPDGEGSPAGDWRWLSGSSEWVEFDDEHSLYGSFRDKDGCAVAERGAEGLRQCLAHWAMHVTSDSDLDRGAAAHIAVTEAVAAQLGCAPNVVELRLVDAKPESKAENDGGKKCLPTAQQACADLLLRLDTLRKQPGRPKTTAIIAAEYGVHVETVRRWEKQARKQSAGAIGGVVSSLTR
ncbi:hypothetical protein [Aquabacterium sp.]|uniref:hypothetical protein n=1 Tax=Aquabacterium sp. TaxID=1872578 RepID=UPI00378316E4